ncbi:hypothetical protein [Neobacillus sp. LXY-1]|uniref:hypothetical protein n=1 Tax=Neobacillus sp. LXY-1 TaxID=3379133 RepID=UPI003EDF11D5
MKREKGYALVLVLIIISIVMIVGLSLGGIGLTNRAQLNKTDSRNKATDLAEMGVTYYQPIVSTYVSSAKITAQNYVNYYGTYYNTYDGYFYNSLYSKLNTANAPVEVDTSNNKYQVTFKSLDKSVANKMIVNFESTGTAGTETATVKGFFTIEKISGASKAGQLNPAISTYSYNEKNSRYLSPPSKLTSYNSSTYFSSLIQIQGNHTLTINGQAFFTSLILAGSAKLNIKGDAIFAKDIVIQDSAVKICITGKTYKLDANNKLVDYPITKNTCAAPSAMEWQFDTNSGTKVSY